MLRVHTNFLGKTIVTVSAAVRTASCSHGWLRRVVEAIFAFLTAASFILILVMSFSNNTPPPPNFGSKCEVFACRVICGDLDLENESESMTNALGIAENVCDRVFLTLKRPMFINTTMASYWLSGTRSEVVELAILGGNLQHISPQAFMTQFGGNIESLILENVTLSTLEPETLVGLSSIKHLFIKETRIKTTRTDALDAVDDTLKVLTITDSGIWDPRYITGSSNLRSLVTVDFSSNDFGKIIGKKSFLRLSSCKVLFLNSCHIKGIGLGAFDDMPKIRNIYLNNNNLMQLPSGLFDKIIAFPVKPRINLQNNPWFCHCSNTELRRLTSEGMLLLDVTCQYPENLRGVFFSQIEKDCSKNESESNDIRGINTNKKQEKIYMNGSCLFKNDSKDTVWNSPIESFHCSNKIIESFKLSVFALISEHSNNNTENIPAHAIIKPSFVLKYGTYNMVELTSQGSLGYGLIWYQSKCPREVYCVHTLPNFLRIYNIEESSKYIFCPLKLNSGVIEECISYSLDLQTSNTYKTFRVILSVSLGVSGLVFGAIFVYGLIRKYPTLLKGNERILLVKHKSVDALVLPPNVPLRTNKPDEVLSSDCKDNVVFYIHEKPKCVVENSFIRTRSMKSSTPTYVSALEPTEDQLAEWRLQHHFDNISIAASSLSLDISTFSCHSDNKSLYYSVNEGSNIYESSNGRGRY